MTRIESSSDRPSGLALATSLVIIKTAIGFIGLTPAYRFGTFTAIVSAIAAAYFLWRGKNWARIVVLCICVVMFLLLLIELPKHDLVRTTRNVVVSAIALFLLYYLNTSAVKSYFYRQVPADSSNQTLQPTPSRLVSFPFMIKTVPKVAICALIRMLPMLTRSGFPSMSHRFPLAPFARHG